MASHSFPVVRVVLIIFYASPITASFVEPEIYLAEEHYSEWFFNGSKAKCELKHEIPQFGVSRFLRLAGEELTFHIQSFQQIPVSIEGVIKETSPPWKHLKPDPLTSPVNLKQGLLPIVVERKMSAWLLASLAKGQVPSFDFLDWNDTRKKVHVRLSPVNYQKPYREFKRCLKEISNVGYEDYRLSEVHFALDVYTLSESEQQYLQSLAEFVIADSSISGIRVDGHADDQGTKKYNERLSGQRADTVAEYLRHAGIETIDIEKISYGETRPKIRSRSERARTANRRVEIHLSR